MNTLVPPKTKPPSKLFIDLQKVQDGDLKKMVEESEGLKSPVETVHAKRKMRCYSITESELLQLSLVNTLVAFAWSVVSGIIVFMVDVIKDILLSNDEIPQHAISLGGYVIPVLVFFLLAALLGVRKAGRWRKRLIDLIKEESNDNDSINQNAKWKLQWPLSKK